MVEGAGIAQAAARTSAKPPPSASACDGRFQGPEALRGVRAERIASLRTCEAVEEEGADMDTHLDKSGATFQRPSDTAREVLSPSDGSEAG
jgi:hypothetical protein